MITRSRQVALLLFNEVELLDFAGLVQVLTLAGRHWNWRPFKIHPVAQQAGMITTSNQLRIEATVALSDCPAPEIVILPGGYGATVAVKNEATVAWLSQVVEKAEAVACVGNGALLLSATGKYPSEAVSVPPNAAASLKDQHSALIGTTTERLTLGQKVISARTSEGSMDLGLELVQRFLGGSLKKRVQGDLMLIGPQEAPLDLTGLTGDNDGSREKASDSGQ
ncbi:MAG TPA: DJ-1/PfpI family protein [Polyangiaceae bacterium]|nr:DJ-1/PfpI family protein [Polyangiaceae bacterium]